MMKNVFLSILILSTVLTSSIEAGAAQSTLKAEANTALATGAATTAVAAKAETSALTGSTITSEATPLVSVGTVATEDQIPLTIDATQKNGPAAGTSAKAVMSLVVVMILIGVSFYMVRRYNLWRAQHPDLG